MISLRALLMGVAGLSMTVSASRAATQILVPQGFNVPAVNNTGASFTYQGVVVPGDTLSITVGSISYLESGPAYGTNAAGVVLVAGVVGNQPVGSALSCNTIDAVQFDCGALIVSISSGTKTYYGRLFPAVRKTGLGRNRPPSTLTFTGSLKKLFGKDSAYKSFRFRNPTFTFLLSDTQYPDNTGEYTISNK